MEIYKAIAPVSLHGGKVRLTEAQAKPRRKNLVAELSADPGTFAVVGEIHFKAGEEFGYDGELSKGILAVVESAQTPEAPGGAGGNKATTKEARAAELRGMAQKDIGKVAKTLGVKTFGVKRVAAEFPE